MDKNKLVSLGTEIQKYMEREIQSGYNFKQQKRMENIFAKYVNIFSIDVIFLFNRVSPNARSVTPRYEVVAKMVYYIYDDTW